MDLRQSTASQEVPLGQFLDTDGAVVTGLTIANTDIKVWKTGATAFANKNSGGATEISGGVYYGVFDATDTNTAGPLVIFITVAGALSVRVECTVLPTVIYDAKYAGGNLPAVASVAGAVGSVTGAVGSVSGAVGSVGANGITASSLAADAGTEIAAAVIAAAAADPIHANIEEVNNVQLQGAGVLGNEWRPV